ncbi:hypothetical protein PSY31_23450, partial [Shigella flexneri]|nr:hypothetical protein [Shigella flexneri]
ENAKDLSIILTRNTNIPADANAVSIHVSNPIEFSEGGKILGPKRLTDIEFFLLFYIFGFWQNIIIQLCKLLSILLHVSQLVYS